MAKSLGNCNIVLNIFFTKVFILIGRSIVLKTRPDRSVYTFMFVIFILVFLLSHTSPTSKLDKTLNKFIIKIISQH